MNVIIHIVIVEDNPPDVLVFRESLRRRGIAFTLEHYVNGEDAAKAVAAMTAPPDLFVLDLNIPRIHGLELLEAIRANPVTERATVVVLTSSRASSDKTQAEECGANLYLVKPDGFNEFVDQVGSAIQDLLNRQTTANGAHLAVSDRPVRRARHVRTENSAPPGRVRRRASGKTRAAGSPL